MRAVQQGGRPTTYIHDAQGRVVAIIYNDRLTYLHQSITAEQAYEVYYGRPTN